MKFPGWADGVGSLISISSISMIPIVAIIMVIRERRKFSGTFIEVSCNMLCFSQFLLLLPLPLMLYIFTLIPREGKNKLLKALSQ